MEAVFLEDMKGIEVGVASASCETSDNLTNHIGGVYSSCKGEGCLTETSNNRMDCS